MVASSVVLHAYACDDFLIPVSLALYLPIKLTVFGNMKKDQLRPK
jgi:hypothetical protein